MNRNWLWLGALWTCAASADIYRCDVDGHLRFSDKPCVAGQAPMPVAQLNTMETSAGDRELARQFDDDGAALRKARLAADRKAVHVTHEAQDSRQKQKKKREPKLQRKSGGGKVAHLTSPKDAPVAGIRTRPTPKEK